MTYDRVNRQGLQPFQNQPNSSRLSSIPVLPRAPSTDNSHVKDTLHLNDLAAIYGTNCVTASASDTTNADSSASKTQNLKKHKKNNTLKAPTSSKVSKVSLRSRTNRITKETLDINLFFSQCMADVIRGTNLKFPKHSMKLSGIGLKSTFSLLMETVDGVADKFLYKLDEDRLPF